MLKYSTQNICIPLNNLFIFLSLKIASPLKDNIDKLYVNIFFKTKSIFCFLTNIYIQIKYTPLSQVYNSFSLSLSFPCCGNQVSNAAAKAKAMKIDLGALLGRK